MDIKKIGITGAVGFVVMGVVGGITAVLFYNGHMTSLSEKWFFLNMQMAGLMPNVWGDMTYIAIDVFISGIMYGISGAAMGWALEKFK